MKKKVIIGVIIVVVVLGIIGAAGGDTTNTTNGTQQGGQAQQGNQQQQEAQQAAPEEVDAATLVADFDKNQLAAEDKYKDKTLQLTAKLKNISEGIGGGPYISLEPITGEQFYVGTTIQCMFSDKSQLTSLENDTNITVTGKMRDMSLGIIVLQDCAVVK